MKIRNIKASKSEVNQALQTLIQQGRVKVDASGRYTLVAEPPKADFSVN